MSLHVLDYHPDIKPLIMDRVRDALDRLPESTTTIAKAIVSMRHGRRRVTQPGDTFERWEMTGSFEITVTFLVDGEPMTDEEEK